MWTKNVILILIVVIVLVILGIGWYFGLQKWEYSEDLEKLLPGCSYIAQEYIHKKRIDIHELHSCLIMPLKSIPEAYLIKIEYGPPDYDMGISWNEQIGLRVGNKYLSIGDEALATRTCGAHCVPNYSDWFRMAQRYEEIALDLVQIDKKYFFKVSFDDYITAYLKERPPDIDGMPYKINLHGRKEIDKKLHKDVCIQNGTILIDISLNPLDEFDNDVLNKKLDCSNYSVETIY